MQDDLAFKLEYVHPYLDGLNSSRNRTLRTSCFNSRKLSPVFTGGPGMDEVPPIWVDRAGIKTNITEVDTSTKQIPITQRHYLSWLITLNHYLTCRVSLVKASSLMEL